ncbi:glycosyltransferase [Halopiger aswanensis]|uniref:Glycosyltransferase involved in cell wall biosynthesis n=1 Tax=Halopiger aswanensis TaxID=148449 RepID=A0A419WRI7_9EURY|nr:glycosyltransferase [Halopiger aswanensis]RKD98074.1 glycosyltransferase involved in cell wall biosynthesis [Halopiger aswanensis]
MTTLPTSTTVLWLTPDKPEDISVGRQRIATHLEESGVDVTLRGTTSKTVLQSLRDAGQYDVIIGTTRAGAIAGTAIKLATGTPLIVDHIDPIRQFEENNPRWLATIVRQLENVAFRVADRVLYVYDEEANRVNRFGTATKTALGVDFDRFANPDPDIVERAESALEGTVAENVAIYVGGLEPIYHVRDLLAAATRLDESWTLLVLGTGSLSEQVERAAASHDNIVYPGTVPHEVIPGYLHAADVGVCLVDDPHTLKVLEYGAAGLPTVQVRGRAEERFDGLVEFCDPTPDSIARAIERAGTEQTGSTGSSQSTTTGLQSFAREFDWAEIAETYKNTITNLK